MSNSSKRLGVKGANEIKNHPWFKGVIWEDVANRKQTMPPIEPVQGRAIKE